MSQQDIDFCEEFNKTAHPEILELISRCNTEGDTFLSLEEFEDKLIALLGALPFTSKYQIDQDERGLCLDLVINDAFNASYLIRENG